MDNTLFFRFIASPTDQLDVELRQGMTTGTLPPDATTSTDEEKAAWVDLALASVTPGIRTILESVAADADFNNQARHAVQRQLAMLQAQMKAIEAQLG